jgi:hypothetical protein
MKMKISILVLIVLISGSFLICSAQENDFGSWVSFGISKDLSKKISLEGEEEIRIFKNFSEIDRFATSFGGVLSIVKGVKAGVGYSWIYDHDVKDTGWENRHRIFAYLQGKADLGRLTFTLREKFQMTYYDKTEDDYDFSPQNYLRSRLAVAYDIKGSKIRPYLAAEMHYQLNNPEGNEIDNMRYTLGSEFPLSKKLDLDTFVRLNQELNVKKPENLYLLGISLNFDL